MSGVMNLSVLSDSDWQLPLFEIHELKPKETRYCIVIPVINEGDHIRQQLKRMQEQKISEKADIVIADGGSNDGSIDPALFKALNVRTVLVKTGPGKLSAQLRMAYAYALRQGYAGIVTVDGNGKDGLEAIPNFMRMLDQGYDFIQGSRFISGGQAINTPLARWLGIRCVHAPLISLGARHWFTDTTNGFRAYSRRLLLDKRVQPFRDIFTTYELLAYFSVRAPRLNYKIIEIPVRRTYPASGKIPTKIHSQGYWVLIRILFQAVRGKYNPA